MKPLKPVMAALLAASSVAFALPRAADATGPAAKTASSPAGDPAPESKSKSETLAQCPPADDEKNSINILACMVSQDPQARKDIGERLAYFVMGHDGPQYLTTALSQDAALMPGVVAEAMGWPEQNKDNPGKVAVLYFVLGPRPPDVGAPIVIPSWMQKNLELSKIFTPGMKRPADGAPVPVPIPAWVLQNPVLAETFVPGMTWNERLKIALANDHWTDSKQISQSGAADAVVAFLNDAAKKAQKVFDDTRPTPKIKIDIGANDTTGLTLPNTKKSNPLDSTGSGFGFDDLYRTGAKVADIYGPKDAGFRTLSMKVYTTKDADGNPINKIGIVDITKDDINTPSATQFIDSSHAGDTDIVMREGGRHYTVTVGSDGGVTLKRAGAKDGGGSIETSKTELSAKRDDQIRNSGTVTIGGLPYYVLGQGGQKGSYLFFSKAQLDAAPTGNAHPDLMGEVSQVLGDGTTAPIKGKPDLGTLQDGTPWHLEFDMQTRLWKVAAGAGDVKVVKDDKVKQIAVKGKKSGDPKVGAADAGGTGDGADAADAATLDQAVALATQDKPDNPSQVWDEDAGNDGFDAETLAQVRIMSNVQNEAKQFEVLFDPSFGVNGGQFRVLFKDAAVRARQVRGVGKYIALEFSASTSYYDLENFAKFAKSEPAEPSGTFTASNGQMSSVKSVEIMEDILVHDMKVKAGDPRIAVLRDRVKKNAKDKGYLLSGNLTTTIYLGIGEEGLTIWPDEKKAGDKGTNANMTGLHGPGAVYSISGSAVEPYSPEIELGQGRVAKLEKTENHAALYSTSEDQDDGTSAKVWSLMVEYKRNGLASRSNRVPLTLFTGMDALPAYHLQGLADVEVGAAPLVGMLYGSDRLKSGAIVLYRVAIPDAQDGSNVKNKKGNCGGPVFWWGDVTKEQAQKACEGDSKIP